MARKKTEPKEKKEKKICKKGYTVMSLTGSVNTNATEQLNKKLCGKKIVAGVSGFLIVEE